LAEANCGRVNAVFMADSDATQQGPSQITAVQRLAIAGLLAGSAAALFAAVSPTASLAKPLAATALCLAGAGCVQAWRQRQRRGLELAGLAFVVGLIGVCLLGRWPRFTGRGQADAVAADLPVAVPMRAARSSALSPTVAPAGGVMVRPDSPGARAAVESRLEASAAEWVDAASSGVLLRDVRARVLFVQFAATGPANGQSAGSGNSVTIRVKVANEGSYRKIEFEGWGRVPDRQAPVLTDNQGRRYAQRPFGSPSGGQEGRLLRPGRVLDDTLVFETSSLDGVTDLFLELPASAVGLNGSLRFRIPRRMVRPG
jgi:hypothetical protein